MVCSYIARSTSSSTGLDLARLPLLPERRPLLVDQPVAREVRRAESQRGLQVGLPHRQRRAGDAEDQVERPAREPRAGPGRAARSTSSGAWFRSRTCEQAGWNDWAPRLTRFTPAVGQDVGLLDVERARVRLDGPLAARRPAGTSGGSSPASRASCAASSRVGVPPPTKIVSTSCGAAQRHRHLALEAPRGSDRPGDRRRPARRSRSSRTCVRRTGRGRRPRGARPRASLGTDSRRHRAIAGRIRGRPRGSGSRGSGPSGSTRSRRSAS